ncbi:MAG: single-stranded DNA-binding protein [Verrucomicrobia bacterium]|nr:single-stranded DNA-binding protein [Verrucomicrobiota bacterium]MDA1085837.1 single-stranded DNA-binding protein [Verrucomicrobiota bacterium]
MSGYNRVVVMGNLTRDPELKSISGDTSVAVMGLAINDTYRSRDGKEIDRTCFVEVEAWGKQGETCAEYLAKGSPALIEGKLQLDQWESKEGEQRSRIKIRADQVKFLGKPRNADSNGGSNNGSRRQNREPEHLHA